VNVSDFSAPTLSALRTLFLNWQQGILQLTPGTQAALPAGLADLAEALRTRRSPSSEFGALSAIVAGWGCYFSGDLPQASAHFSRAWEADEGWNTWAALGLGKVASDAGRWNLARAWLLQTMALARADDDSQHLAAASGALAEVFCRATPHRVQPGDAPADAALLRAAYELLELDAALLPVGSPFHWRVENYRALCLGRLGALEQGAGSLGRRAYREAQARMWASHYATSSVDPVSADYALASLYLLSLRASSHDLYQRAERRFAERLTPEAAPMVPYPLGVVEAVRAFWAGRADDDEKLVAHLAAARDAFGPHAPLEQTWALALQAQLQGTAPPVAAIQALQARHHPSPPVHPRVAGVDRVYETLVLPPDDPPFEWLTEPSQLWAGLGRLFV